MVPYIKILYSLIKITLLKLFSSANINTTGLQIFSYNTRLSFGKQSIITLGNKIISDGRLSIISDNNSILTLGNNIYFNEGCMISCKSKIVIGSGCQFGPSVKIFDNDHDFDSKHGVKHTHKTTPIIIGSNAIILRGSKIGNNCVIGAGTIIKNDIPDNTIITQQRNLIIRNIN